MHGQGELKYMCINLRNSGSVMEIKSQYFVEMMENIKLMKQLTVSLLSVEVDSTHFTFWGFLYYVTKFRSANDIVIESVNVFILYPVILTV